MYEVKGHKIYSIVELTEDPLTPISPFASIFSFFYPGIPFVSRLDSFSPIQGRRRGMFNSPTTMVTWLKRSVWQLNLTNLFNTPGENFFESKSPSPPPPLFSRAVLLTLNSRAYSFSLFFFSMHYTGNFSVSILFYLYLYLWY